VQRDAIVRVRGVTRVFRSSGGMPYVHALGPIDLSLQPGEFFAVVGPSGCGKSTLLEVIAGLSPPTQGEVLFYRDGINGTVSVHREGQYLFLRVNGKMDAGNRLDMPTQLMLGHLPLLVHQDPRAVLLIGLGSGITAGAVVRHPIERLDVVEIEPAVVEASRFFAWEHGDVLKDSKVHAVIADGRNFLLTTSNRYDVIISEPSNPWIGGLASLFSVEFFQLARQRLNPGGIMAQWVQGYNLLPDDLRMVVKTFRSVFPATTVWNATRGDFLLLGRAESTPLNLTLFETRFPRIRADLDAAVARQGGALRDDVRGRR